VAQVPLYGAWLEGLLQRVGKGWPVHIRCPLQNPGADLESSVVDIVLFLAMYVIKYGGMSVGIFERRHEIGEGVEGRREARGSRREKEFPPRLVPRLHLDTRPIGLHPRHLLYVPLGRILLELGIGVE